MLVKKGSYNRSLISTMIIFRCANHTRQYGLKYFALGDDDCMGYGENEISVENLSLSQCQQEDQNNCNGNSSLPACYGRAGFQFVYGLVSILVLVEEQNSKLKDLRPSSWL